MKTMKNMKWMAALVMTASLVTACSTEDDLADIENPVNQHKVLTLTTTISMSDKANTRSKMTDTGSGITAEWEVGDKFEVLHMNSGMDKYAQAEVIAVDPSTKDATITVDLVDPSNGDRVWFSYPYEEFYQMLEDVIQSGKLDDIKDHYTRISGSGNLSVSGNTVSIPDGIEMEQRTAIWKLSFTDGTKDITSSITNLNIYTDGYKAYQVAPSSLNVIYLALDYTYSSQDFYFEATTPTGVYSKSKAGIKLDAGKVYTSTGVALSPIRDGNTVYLNKIMEYEAQDGEVLTGKAGERVHITIADGATITLNNADITSLISYYSCAGLNCLGDATINLSGTNSIKGASSYPGIYVPANKTLTIQGDGQLTINSSNDDGAGIGGGYSLDCGNIIIKEGDITTSSIGSGYSGTCGNITIEGGDITTTRGIGSKSDGTCGNIIIKGGTINSTGQYAPGIGGKCGNITISGGEITSTGNYSPGIGGTCDNITIEGGTIIATGDGWSSGIGGNCGDIIISGGDITSTGSNSPGIGPNSSSTSVVSCGNIIISGGNVTAIGGSSAGIGGGYFSGNNCLDITISGSSTIVNATVGGDYSGGAGIGGGNSGNCGKITIEDGTVTASGGYGGAGIGGGYGSWSGDPLGTCDNITIKGGTIIASGGKYAAGIGGGYNGICDNINIVGGTVNATGGSSSAAIGGGYYGNCGDVTITNTVTQINATMGSYSSTTIGKGSYSTCGTVTIGGTVYAEGITESPYTYQP